MYVQYCRALLYNMSSLFRLLLITTTLRMAGGSEGTVGIPRGYPHSHTTSEQAVPILYVFQQERRGWHCYKITDNRECVSKAYLCKKLDKHKSQSKGEILSGKSRLKFLTAVMHIDDNTTRVFFHRESSLESRSHLSNHSH